jgi:hypothetical protein
MITHTMPLPDINKGFELMHEGKSIRSVVVYCPLAALKIDAQIGEEMMTAKIAAMRGRTLAAPAIAERAALSGPRGCGGIRTQPAGTR